MSHNSKKLMSLFIGKSNKNCNEVSQESCSSSLELDDESETIFLTPHKNSFLTMLAGVEEAKSVVVVVVVADNDSHLIEDSDLWTSRKDSPTSEFQMRRK